MKIKSKGNKKPNRLQKLFSKYFGFEEGVDIGDDIAVLHRRNIVIKNITVITSLFYSALFLGLSLSVETQITDWLFTFLSFPITYIIKQNLEKIMYSDPENKDRQRLASYIASFIIFFTSLLAYFRLYSVPMLETVGYVLLFYALVVISLYQDKAILFHSFSIMIIIMSVINLLLPYRVKDIAAGLGFFEFIPVFVKTDEFIGFILRGLLFMLFYGVIYITVSIGQFLQDERRNELNKRREVQGDFSEIVKDLFSAVLFDVSLINEDPHYEDKILSLSVKLGKSMGLNHNELEELKTFSTVHLRHEELEELATNKAQFDEGDYNVLKEKTEVGAKIVSRIELVKKAESIINRFIFNEIREDFIEQMNEIQPEKNSNIIVFIEAYLMFRDSRPGKRPYSHDQFVEHIQKDIGKFFPNVLVERFLILNQEFNKLYRDLNDVTSF